MSDLNDLIFLSTDAGLLKSVEDAVTKIEYRKFLHAIEELRKTYSVVKNPTSNKQFDTETRIELMDKEIHDLQQESYYKEQSHRRLKEQHTRDRLNKIKNRKARIDGKLVKEIKRMNPTIASFIGLERTYKQLASLDFVVALDCTGSMTPYLTAMKTKAVEMVTSLDKLYPDMAYRVAFVGYKDHCDGAQRVSVLPFTEDLLAFAAFVNRMEPFGGCGETADVFGALQEVGQLHYQAATRVLYHIGDAPCHGRDFHSVRQDCNPRGDPRGLRAEELLRTLLAQEVLYCFGKINESTDTMIERFNAMAASLLASPSSASIIAHPPNDAAFVQVTPVDGGNVMRVIHAKVAASVLSTVSTSSRTDSSLLHSSSRQTQLMASIALAEDAAPPADWGRAMRGTLRHAAKLPTSLDEMVQDDDPCSDHDDAAIEGGVVSVQLAPKPFAKGSSRVAFHATVRYEGPEGGSLLLLPEAAVLKEIVGQGPEACLLKCREALSCHAAATHLALLFNELLRPHSAVTLHFVQNMLIRLDHRPDQPYMTWEEPIHHVGQWEKYNNNSGMCLPCPSLSTGTDHSAVQAFSHWTHSVSGGRLMVVDCQGAYDHAAQRFTLTDPAIHCVSLLKYGGTNIGKKGFARFFKTHSCNHICRAIGIQSAA